MRTDAPLPRTITRKWLNSHNACEEQVELFEKVWPEGVTITQKTLTNAAKAGLDLEWFAGQVLSAAVYAEYKAGRTPLYAEYETKRALLNVAYRAERALVDAACRAKRAPPDSDYETKRNLLYADYETKRAPLNAAYETEYNTLDADYLAKCDVLLITALGAAYDTPAY